jgi:DNA-directed RNA polymerase specialized sigma24 family protein
VAGHRRASGQTADRGHYGRVEEHDIREVATLLQRPERTVKSRLFLARKRLKELLQ